MQALDQIVAALGEDVQREIRQLVEERIAEVRKETEERVRREMIERYEHDRKDLVGRLERFAEQALQEEMTALHEAWRQRVRAAVRRGVLAEQRAARALAEEARQLRNRLQEQIERLEATRTVLAESREAESRRLAGWVRERLQAELGELAADHRRLLEERRRLRRAVAETREQAKAALREGIERLQTVVHDQLRHELADFEKDRRLLEARRVELEREGRRKLAETRRAFVERAARLVEEQVGRMLERELTELREDIHEARRNTFGRRLFEAFAREFVDSHWAEKSVARRLAEALRQTRGRTAMLESTLEARERTLEELKRKVRLMEDRAKRQAVMEKLLAPLPAQDREVMRGLLEGVETPRLREAFERYLRYVVRRRPTEATNAALAESRDSAEVPATTREVVTGDRASPVAASERGDDEVEEILRLAGIRR